MPSAEMKTPALPIFPLSSLADAPKEGVQLPSCNRTFGEVEIPYPFDVGDGCYAEEYRNPFFNVSCNYSADPPRPFIRDVNNPEQIRSLRPPFDFVIAADVVYMEDSVGPLVSAMEALVSAAGAVLLGYQVRSPEAHALFWDLCERSFTVHKVPREHLHPEYAYEEADVFILKKK